MKLDPAATGVSLVDAQRVLGLFAQGLAGRYLHLKSTESLTGNFRPDGITTDGSAIYLPSSVDLFNNRQHNLGVYRIAVLHQVGLFDAGTYDFSIEQARALIPELPAETPRLGDSGVGLARFFSLWPKPTLMRWLFMTLEDLRVDQALLRRFPGAARDLQRVFKQALATRPDMATLPAQAAKLESLLRFSLGDDPQALAARDPTGVIAKLLEHARLLSKENASVYDSALAAVRCYRLLAPEAPDEQTPNDQGSAKNRPGANPAASGGDGLPGEDGDAPPNVEFRGLVLPELVQRQMRIAAITAGLDRAEAMATLPETLQGEAQTGARQLEADKVALYRAFGQLQPGVRSFLYDEWDYRNQHYLFGWCRVFEHRLRGSDFDFMRQVRDRHAALMREIRRQFLALRPESHRRERPVSDGDQFDLDAVVDAVIDRRNGQAPDERVYVRSVRGEREVACAFLLDMSASTDYPVTDRSAQPTADANRATPNDDPYLWAVGHSPDDLVAQQPPIRRVIDVTRESLAMMSEALHVLGDSHAVYGFSGQGREEVDFYIAKDFDDPVSDKTWANIAQMKPRRSTRMGPAIRHAATRLAAQPARTRLLILISDGYPEDQDYGPDRHDREYGIQDTACALREAERQGIRTFCVTVDRAGHDYLRRMCAADRYLVIDEIEALPDALSTLYRSLSNASMRTGAAG